MPEIEVLGRLYPNPQTGQASERECRAFGIEWRLLEAMGLKVHAPAFLRHVKGTLAILPDWIAYHKKLEEVQALVLRARDAFTLGEITDRMVGWLDKTVERQRHGA